MAIHIVDTERLMAVGRNVIAAARLTRRHSGRDARRYGNLSHGTADQDRADT